MKKIMAWVSALFFLGMISCQSYGQTSLPRVSHFLSLQGTPADFEPSAEQKEKDPAGQILVILVGIGLVVGAVIAVPLIIKKK